MDNSILTIKPSQLRFWVGQISLTVFVSIVVFAFSGYECYTLAGANALMWCGICCFVLGALYLVFRYIYFLKTYFEVKNCNIYKIVSGNAEKQIQFDQVLQINTSFNLLDKIFKQKYCSVVVKTTNATLYISCILADDAKQILTTYNGFKNSVK